MTREHHHVQDSWFRTIKDGFWYVMGENPAMAKKLNAAFNALDHELRIIKDSVDDLKNEDRNIKNAVADHDTYVRSIRNMVAELETKLIRMEFQMTDVKNDAGGMQRTIENIQTNAGGMQRTIENIETNAGGMQRTIENIQTNLFYSNMFMVGVFILAVIFAVLLVRHIQQKLERNDLRRLLWEARHSARETGASRERNHDERIPENLVPDEEIIRERSDLRRSSREARLSASDIEETGERDHDEGIPNNLTQRRR